MKLHSKMEQYDEIFEYWFNRINDYLIDEEIINEEDKIEAVVSFLTYHASLGGLMDTKKYSLIGKSKEYLRGLGLAWCSKYLS